MSIRSLTTVALMALTFVAWSGPAAAQEEEEAGNNLSLPVIWGDGATKVLPGVFGAPTFAGETFVLDGVTYYLQKSLGNTWQAESLDQTTVGPIDVSWVDWGDNLEARSWFATSIVRVETTLYQDLPVGGEMTGFEMAWLWGEGTDEMWGTNGLTYDSLQATVYSGNARLTIQKLTEPGATANLTWDKNTGEWKGDVQATLFNNGVWAGGEGKPGGFYTAELNIPGKVVYGYNWNVRLTASNAGVTVPEGFYRITFSLDNAAASGVTLNTFFTNTKVFVSEEEGEVEEVEAEAAPPDTGSGGEPAGGSAFVDPQNNLSYIDIEILPAKGSKGGGGGKPISSVTLTADVDLNQPQGVGAPIELTADATGGVSVNYKFFVYDGTSWTAVQDWSTDDTYTFHPNKSGSDYQVGVWVRSADGTLDAPETSSALASVGIAVSDAASLAIQSLTADKPSPQAAGTTITFTAAADGGQAPYQYKWYLFNGTAWSVLADWSGSSSFAWTPTVPNSNYRVGVWVRSDGDTGDEAETAAALASMAFVIQ